jgi:hypothetical protein
MHELTILIVAFTKFLKEVTNRHTSHIIFMEEFTFISFIAQLTQPVLADYHSLPLNVSEGAVEATSTRPLQEKLA